LNRKINDIKRKYLIDIPHPHFAHFFSNLITLLGKETVIITCQDSGIITNLLDSYGLKYIVVGKKYNNIAAKAFGQVKYWFKYLVIARKYRIDLFLGMSPSVAFAAKVCGKKMFFFDDDDSVVQPFTKKITIPLSDYIITPKCLEFENYGGNHLTYMGYQELAYLSPAYFNPDIAVINKYGLMPDSYFVLRFNDFRAHHDIGQNGIPDEVKEKLIQLLLQFGKVYITSEGDLDDKYAKHQLKINPQDIHHVLAYAKMYIGDSQTMTSEAAVLGTPAIRCNTFKGKISYLKELEDTYQLTYAFLPSESDLMLDKVKTLLSLVNIKLIWKTRKETMLSKMTDVNQYILKLLDRELS